jgi:lysophospholipase L1-like esterase
MILKKNLRRLLLAVAFIGGATALVQHVTAAPTVYIAGDSTVMSYRASYNLYPQQGWGGRLPEYFTTAVTFSNHAIGGRSSNSFVDDGHLATILAAIQPGDYLLIQFGHNDGNTSPALFTDPFTTYKTYLAMYIDGAVLHGATPVLVTPMGRRSYDSNGAFINDFVDRCTAMKQLAIAKNCKLIDLNTKSIAYYNSIGVNATTNVFLWLAAGLYPNFPTGVQDHTHFQEYGASQLAGLVAQGIQEINLPIKSFIRTPITYPAESATFSGTGMTLETINPGYHGTGYVNFPTTGGTLTFNNVNGGTGGTHNLRFRCTLGITTARTGQLVVNGVTTSLIFYPTGTWSTWVTVDASVTLASGTANTIQLKSTGQDLSNVDELTVY